MCLERLYSQRTVAKYRNLAKKKGYLRVYKELYHAYLDRWESGYSNGPFKAGLNEKESARIICSNGMYSAGFHCCPGKIKWEKPGPVVECLVKPEWIRTAGKQWDQTVLVCDKVFMPTYPSKKALVKDFKKL